NLKVCWTNQCRTPMPVAGSQLEVLAVSDRQDLLEGRDALEHLAAAVDLESGHAALDRELAELVRVHAVEGRLADLGRHVHELVRADSTAETLAVAVLAAVAGPV